MTTLIIANEILQKKVSVTYSDGKGSHETTVQKVIEKFKSEEEWWLDKFLNNLINTGEAHSNFGGTYKLETI